MGIILGEEDRFDINISDGLGVYGAVYMMCSLPTLYTVA